MCVEAGRVHIELLQSARPGVSPIHAFPDRDDSQTDVRAAREGDAIYTANVEDGGFPCQLILRDALQKLYVYT